MKIKLNSEALRMTVLKQIVNNACIGLSVERKMGIISYIFPFTPSCFRLRRIHDRGEKLEQFEKSLSLNKDEFVYIEFKDVDFIYKGLPT